MSNPSGPGPTNNPLINSGFYNGRFFFESNNFGSPPSPPVTDGFKLLDGDSFELLSGDDFTLLE